MRARVKYEAIYKNRYGYRISFLCQFFEVSRSGYYAWLKHRGEPDKETQLAKMIQECQKKIYLWMPRSKDMA